MSFSNLWAVFSNLECCHKTGHHIALRTIENLIEISIFLLYIQKIEGKVSKIKGTRSLELKNEVWRNIKDILFFVCKTLIRSELTYCHLLDKLYYYCLPILTDLASIQYQALLNTGTFYLHKAPQERTYIASGSFSQQYVPHLWQSASLFHGDLDISMSMTLSMN